MEGSNRTLLKVISILFLIFGVFSVITAVVGIIGGGLLAAAGAPGAGILAALAVIGCLGGILEFIAGIKGLQNKLAQCRTLGMILLVLAVLGLIFSGFRFTWSNVTAIVLPILYLLGAKKQD